MVREYHVIMEIDRRRNREIFRRCHQGMGDQLSFKVMADTKEKAKEIAKKKYVGYVVKFITEL